MKQSLHPWPLSPPGAVQTQHPPLLPWAPSWVLAREDRRGVGEAVWHEGAPLWLGFLSFWF